MTPIQLDLPAEAITLFNHLYDPPRDASCLEEDLIAIKLPNDIFIDVGWYPPLDPEGHYVIRLYRQSWDKQLIDPIESACVTEVVNEIQRLAANPYGAESANKPSVPTAR
jgi:hypothetical protein